MLSVILGDSVDEVSILVKKHDAFEKLLATQEEKVIALQEHSEKLLAQNHFESSIIARRLAEVLKRRAKVKQLCELRRLLLDDALLYAQFVRDVGEVSSLLFTFFTIISTLIWIGRKTGNILLYEWGFTVTKLNKQ